jgi:hypothetical protein
MHDQRHAEFPTLNNQGGKLHHSSSSGTQESCHGSKEPKPKAAFPFVAVKNLKAFYLGKVYHGVRGQPLDSTLFNADATRRWIGCITKLNWLQNNREPAGPLPLISFNEWLTFEECLFTWCAKTRSPRTNVLLSCLLQPQTNITDKMRAQTYDSIDDNLIATMLLMGPDVLHDNQQLYDHLKGWMQDGPAWSFLQEFNCNRDGRGAYLAVKPQAEGQATPMSRKVKAYRPRHMRLLLCHATLVGQSSSLLIPISLNTRRHIMIFRCWVSRLWRQRKSGISWRGSMIQHSQLSRELS